LLVNIPGNQVSNGIRKQIIVQGNFIIIQRKVFETDCEPGALIGVRQRVALSDAGSVFGGNFEYIIEAIIGNRVVDSGQRTLQDRNIIRPLIPGSVVKI